MLNDFYRGKRVFVTGHTGFKGCWLVLMLQELGAEVFCYALEPEDTRGNLFNLVELTQQAQSEFGDIRNFEQLQEALGRAQPEVVFHLAAQALVRDSYEDPLNNYDTNIMGTANLLQAVIAQPGVQAVVNITTDKCYENKEWEWPYRENDRLGGHDPYSASKACCEIVTESYRKSFFETRKIGLASARAGNVIGGGDFAKDRIIPDIIEALQNNKTVVLRNPNAVRPWQHVLDVLWGYLLLGKNVYEDPAAYSQAFNFSTVDPHETTVREITQAFIQKMGRGEYEEDPKAATVHEAQMLRLDPSRAIKQLGWKSAYDVLSAVDQTAEWYSAFLKGEDIKTLCRDHLQDFMALQ